MNLSSKIRIKKNARETLCALKTVLQTHFKALLPICIHKTKSDFCTRNDSEKCLNHLLMSVVARCKDCASCTRKQFFLGYLWDSDSWLCREFV